MSAPATKVLFLGDSISEGYAMEDGINYPTFTQRILRDQYHLSIEAINAGVSGDTTSDGLNRFRCIIPSEKKIYQNLSILFIALGTNDALQGWPTELIFNHLKAIIELGKAQDMEIILAGTELPHGWEISYGEDYALAFKEIYPRLAKMYSLTQMEILQKNVANVDEYNLPDKLHPNAAGYEVIARHVSKILASVLKRVQQKSS